MSEHASAWKPIIDEWTSREARLHRDMPIKPDSVRVRDAVEIDDRAYVLVSYDVDHPWPQEEDTDDGAAANTAVIQAARVRQPWIEQDSARALAHLRTAGGEAIVSEHPLGRSRAFSGNVRGAVEHVVLEFDDGTTSKASVVDGWFLSVAPDARRLVALLLPGEGDGNRLELDRDDSSDMFEAARFTRSAGRSLYFSPLDLRGVVPLIQWERESDVVVVAVCLEQYDEGCVLRLRIDGTRVDDDIFVSWPVVTLEVDGQQLPTAIVGESTMADTISIDVGFRPALQPSTNAVTLTVSGLRGLHGPIDAITFRIDVSGQRR